DPLEARAVVDRAESMIGWEQACLFCSIAFSLPAAIACVRVDDVECAQRHLEMAERAGVLWHGTSWEAGIAEARAVVAAANGDPAPPRRLLQSATEQFERAGQPLDAQRCRLAIAAY